MRKRKICVITGARSEYGLLKPIMDEISNNKNLDLLIMVAGMHLSKEFGKTIDLIKKDGLKITYQVEMSPRVDSPEFMALSIGQGIIRMTSAFLKNTPEIVVVLGDRIEALAATIANAYLNIPVAHIHGGDKSKAGLDESARHAITKFSHIHFTATKTSTDRVIKMGEDPKNVFLVGAPGLDTIIKSHFLSLEELSRKYALNIMKPFLLVLQHSVTTQVGQAKKQIRETLGAIRELKIPTLIIYPNSDSGGRVIINEIEKNRHLKFIKIFKSIPHNLYLNLLKHASVLIGNSSSGIIESPYFKLPVVNIGIRQEGRERSTNVIDAPHEKNAIIKTIKKALYKRKFIEEVKKCKNPYGDGNASQKIVKILEKIKINKKLLQKTIVY